MIPREKIAQFSSAPPLKRLKSAATPPALSAVLRNHSCNTAWFTPGVVIAAPRRTITMIARVKRIRRRSSGIFTVFRNAEIIDKNYFPKNIVILSEVEGSRGVTVKLSPREPSTSLGMTGVEKQNIGPRLTSAPFSFAASLFLDLVLWRPLARLVSRTFHFELCHFRSSLPVPQ